MLVISWEQGQKLEKLSVIGQVPLFGASCYRGSLGLPRLIFSFSDSSVRKESACNRRPQFNSWVRKILWRRDKLPTPGFLGFPCDSASKESAWNMGDLCSILGWGRSPGEGNSYPLKYSGLENSMGCRVHEVGHDWVISLHFAVQSCVVWWSPIPLVCFCCFAFAVKKKKKVITMTSIKELIQYGFFYEFYDFKVAWFL